MNKDKLIHKIKVAFTITLLTLVLILLLPRQIIHAEQINMKSDTFFTLEDGRNLRVMGDNKTKELLTCVHGQGKVFGDKEKRRYFILKKRKLPIQWVLNELETGEILSQSDNAEKRYFGASSSKLFVAAAFLHKHNGQFTQKQLGLLVSMIVRSNNAAWLELQRQTGTDGTDNSGRQAVDEFVKKMGYTNTRGFQGWMIAKDGSRVHGNELNTIELAAFLNDTYHNKYKGAEILWKIMHAAKTGTKKIDRYTPIYVYIGGKTGTYDGENSSPGTIKFGFIRARNHISILKIEDKYYGLSILSNTGSSEDVAILGGGLIREFLINKRNIPVKRIN